MVRGSLVGVEIIEPDPDPDPEVCVPGITDTFNRGDTTVAEGLGTSDSTLPWMGESIGSPSIRTRINSSRLRAVGWYDPDDPGSAGGDTPIAQLRPPGYTRPSPPFGLGPLWPLPFGVGMVMQEADSSPMFTGPDFMLGEPWRVDGAGYNLSGEFKTPAPPSGLSSGRRIFTTVTGATYGTGKHFSPYAPITITGRIRVVEVASQSPYVLEDYIDIDFLGAFISWNGFGVPGTGDSIISFGGLDPDESDDFPTFFWTDAAGDWVDFTVTHPGGTGGLLTVTVGPCTVSKTLTGLLTDFSIGSFLRLGDAGVPAADWYLDGNLTINDLQIEQSLGWKCQIRGTTASNHTLVYTFSYQTYGAAMDFVNAYDTGDVAYPAVGSTPYPGGYPAVMGPVMIVRIEDTTSGSKAIAWHQFDEALDLPAIAYIEIGSFGASMQLGGSMVTALANDAVDAISGDSEPLGLVTKLVSPLRIEMDNGIGTFFDAEDLNVTGVNNCTVPATLL